MKEKSFITLSPDFGPRLFSPHQDMQHGIDAIQLFLLHWLAQKKLWPVL